jgi:hypothetical protein
MSAELQVAVMAWEQARKAEAKAEEALVTLQAAMRQLPTKDLSEFARRTEEVTA